MRSTQLPVIGALLATTAVACGTSQGDARKYLEEHGMTVMSLKKQGDGVDYTATKGSDICTGSVFVRKGIGTTSSSHTSSCKRDTRACKGGAPAECVRLADEMYSADAKVFPTTAAELYRTACSDRNGHACARAAEFEKIGEAWADVRSYARKGCDLGDGDACVTLGFTELRGQGTAKSEAKALEFMQKACASSAMRGCLWAAELLLDEEPANATAALPLAEKACGVKLEDGCFVLGRALFEAKKDYPLALTHLDAACNDPKLDAIVRNRGLACNLAGAIAFDGRGMKRDPARGMASLEKSCDLGHALGCYNAGKFYNKGTGVARNKEKAEALLAKACKLGKTDACTR